MGYKTGQLTLILTLTLTLTLTLAHRGEHGRLVELGRPREAGEGGGGGVDARVRGEALPEAEHPVDALEPRAHHEA